MCWWICIHDFLFQWRLSAVQKLSHIANTTIFSTRIRVMLCNVGLLFHLNSDANVSYGAYSGTAEELKKRRHVFQLHRQVCSYGRRGGNCLPNSLVALRPLPCVHVTRDPNASIAPSHNIVWTDTHFGSDGDILVATKRTKIVVTIYIFSA